MYEPLITAHVWTSSLFVIVALVLNYIALRDLILKKQYSKYNNILELLFIILLYVGLVFGIVLYFFLAPENKTKMLSYQEALENANMRYWAIEHFCIMLFALILAQIGRIFTIKKISSFHKFKYALFYYGMATIITFTSTSLYLYNKFFS